MPTVVVGDFVEIRARTRCPGGAKVDARVGHAPLHEHRPLLYQARESDYDNGQ